MDGACRMQRVPRNTYNLIRMIKSRNVKGVGHVARIAGKSAYKVLIGKPEEREQWEDLEVYSTKMYLSV